MGSKQLSADLNFAWPTARIAVIGAEGAAQLLVKRFPDPTAPEVQKIRADFIEGYNLNTGHSVDRRRARLHRRRDPAARDPAAAAQVSATAAGQADHAKVQRKYGLTPIWAVLLSEVRPDSTAVPYRWQNTAAPVPDAPDACIAPPIPTTRRRLLLPG